MAASRDGHVLPRVGVQCEAALGAVGARVDATALEYCISTLVETWVARANSPVPPHRPNLIVILTDDQRWDTIDATHSPDRNAEVPAMPSVLERLANEGVTFKNAFVNDPVCGPSRASFLTGQNASTHGTLRNSGSGGGTFFDDSSTVATWLQDAGYRTGFFGKYINWYAARRYTPFTPPFMPTGWDDWRAFLNNRSIDHGRFTMVENGAFVDYGYGGPSVYSTDVVADHALSFIDDAAMRPEPFFAYINTAAPHFPYNPAPRHEGEFSESGIFQPPSYFEEDVSGKPSWVRALPPMSDSKHNIAQALRRSQLEMQLSVDELVNRLMDKLEELEIDRDTAIIFTSDNGMAWGEHRWLSKSCPYEVCIRVPMIVRYPRLAPLKRSEDAMVVNVDLASTLAELAGVPAPADRDGVSFMRAIDATARESRGEFLFESYSGSNRTFAGVRSESWKFIENRSDEPELYDLERDPDELDNLALDPKYAEVRAHFEQRLYSMWPGFDAIPD